MQPNVCSVGLNVLSERISHEFIAVAWIRLLFYRNQYRRRDKFAMASLSTLFYPLSLTSSLFLFLFPIIHPRRHLPFLPLYWILEFNKPTVPKSNDNINKKTNIDD